MHLDDLTKAVAARTGNTETMTRSMVKAVLEVATETLKAGEVVRLQGFGTFEVKDRSERTGRNPKTGEAIIIPACKAVAFKAHEALKKAVE